MLHHTIVYKIQFFNQIFLPCCRTLAIQSVKTSYKKVELSIRKLIKKNGSYLLVITQSLEKNFLLYSLILYSSTFSISDNR